MLLSRQKHTIKLNTKNVYSKGMYENVCHAIKIALDLKIEKIIKKTLPLLSFEAISLFKKRKN